MRPRIDRTEIARAIFRDHDAVLGAFVDLLPVGYWATDADGHLVVAPESPFAATLTSDAFERRVESLLTSGDSEKLRSTIDRALRGEASEATIRVVERTFRVLTIPWREHGRIVGVLGCSIDTSTKDTAAAEIRASEERLDFSQSAAGLGSWEVDLRTRTSRFSRELYRLAGYEPYSRDLDVRAMWAGVHPEDREGLSLALAAARERKTSFIVETRCSIAGGTERWIEHRGRYRYDGEVAIGVVGTALDVTARKSAEVRLAHNAHFDALTDLPNRKLLLDRLQHAIAASQRAGTMLAVFVVDVDRFKIINDTLGHAAGDALLRAAAPRLASALGEGVTIARVGGDEFVAVVTGLETPDDAARIARDLNETLAEPFEIEHRELFVTASIGISCSPTDGERAEQLIRNADAAMYRAKEAGRNTFCFYAPSIHARAVDRLVLESQLRRALDNGEFAIHYQPIVDASERVVAVESLVRWNHPLLGTIRPDAFIPLCEEIGLIVPIGRWVLRTAIAQMTAWRERGVPNLRLAINVSGRQMVGDEFSRFVAETLREYNFRAADLELEITESAVMNDLSNAGTTLAELKSLGVRVCLDDFGTGYCSLSYLKHFKVDTLKIDRSVVRDLPHDRGDAAIVAAVGALGGAMGVRVVAEGVETAAQAALVRKLGCHELQGYHFWRPVPASEVEAILKTHSAPTRATLRSS